MARLPMRAKHQRPDGTPVVMCETANFLHLDEAAHGLALIYAHKGTVLQGEPAVRDGLMRVVVEQPAGEPDPDRVAGYRQVVQRLRKRFLRYAWDAAGVLRPVVKLGLDQDQATHVRVDTPTYFSEVEAARALALVHEGFPQGVRVGRMTCEHGLHRAARDRVWLRGDEPDEDAVVEFRRLLREFEVF